MAQQQAFRTRSLRNLGGLAGGTMMGLGRSVTQLFQESSLVVKQVDPANEVGQGGRIQRVGEEGVAARNGHGAGHIGVAQAGLLVVGGQVVALGQAG